ncbi:MAG: alpha/beta fold hydrolase, partial [Gammaproteobacteria bacterium]|nr:alpha/beta fold hydrolase [Gammaproteobacteria bacterium]
QPDRAQIRVGGRLWRARIGKRAGPRFHPPVVLVHGFGISSSYFVPMIERLEPEFDVYAPDLPGHGRSAAPPRALGIVELADGLHEWLEAAGLPATSLVGHSMGCQVVVELAVRYPAAADRLVLIGPTLDAQARSILRAAPRLLAGSGDERASMIGLIARDYLRMAPRLLAEFRAMQSHRIEERLPRVAKPVLLVRGGNDRVAPQRWLDRLERLTPDAGQAVVPDAGHAVQYSAADRLVPLLTPFLRKTSMAAVERAKSE